MRILKTFRFIAIAEGVSFIILLGVAMPMKYFLKMPEAVRIFGMMHGVLFVAFLLLAFQVMEKTGKGFGWLIKAFLFSIVPFGTFILDKELKKMG